jgi:hypothetical protein
VPFKTRDFYKVVGQDGYDLYSHTIDWVALVGETYVHPEDQREAVNSNLRVRHVQGLRPCTSAVVHASVKPYAAIRYGMIRAAQQEEHKYLRMLIVHGTPVTSDAYDRSGHATKYGFHVLEVKEQLTHAEVRRLLEGTTNYDLWGNWRDKSPALPAVLDRVAAPFDRRRRKPLTRRELRYR